MKCILASQSPRRREILKLSGWEFEVIPADLEEVTECTDPGGIAMELATQKAWAVFDQSEQDVPVVGSDTLVWLDGNEYGKPHKKEKSVEMLRTLSGKTHQVISGVCVIDPVQRVSWVVPDLSDVTFRTLTDDEIEMYINISEPFDRAGSYSLEGPGELLVEAYSGDFYSILGLPLQRLLDWESYRNSKEL